MPERDKLFEKPVQKQFEFDESVAAVFDDMIERSVPFYRQNLSLIVDLLLRRLNEGERVVDIGTSTGSLLLELAGRGEKRLDLVGIDNAEAMIVRARRKAEAFGVAIRFELADLLKDPLPRCHAAVAAYTLQFIRPLKRLEAVKKIYQALYPGGMLIVSEKVLMQNKWLDTQIVELYYAYKRSRGYSETEIARKRQALENVLVPYTLEENRSMLMEAGFETVDTIFQWGNFATMVAIKGG